MSTFQRFAIAVRNACDAELRKLAKVGQAVAGHDVDGGVDVRAQGAQAFRITDAHRIDAVCASGEIGFCAAHRFLQTRRITVVPSCHEYVHTGVDGDGYSGFFRGHACGRHPCRCVFDRA